LFQGFNYFWFVKFTKATDEHYVPSEKEKKKIVSVPTIQGQSSGVLQNPNLTTSIIELEADDDEMNDKLRLSYHLHWLIVLLEPILIERRREDYQLRQIPKPKPEPKPEPELKVQKNGEE
jgi:hypothetical protein